MNANKMLWEKGDFTKLAETMRESGQALVASLPIKEGTKVLDLGCGDGTTAIPAVKRGAVVLGVDIASNLVAAGNKRVMDENLQNIQFVEGDACSLEGIETNQYDMLVSIFGAMFAPKPFDVAKEMVRVTKKNGLIVMGNWIPGDPTLVAQILRICSAYTVPPPEGFISPMLWGVEAQVIERFEAAGIAAENISFSKEIFTFKASYSPSFFVQQFRNYYGPTMNAFESAELNGKADDLQKELEDLFFRENISANLNHTDIPAYYLQVRVKC